MMYHKRYQLLLLRHHIVGVNILFLCMSWRVFWSLDPLRQSMLLIFLLPKSQESTYLRSRWLDRRGPQYFLTISYVAALELTAFTQAISISAWRCVYRY